MVINMVLYNFIEVVVVVMYLFENLDVIIEDLMEFVFGLDFFFGGILMGFDGVKDVYMMGCGVFKVCGKILIELFGLWCMGIIVLEFFYMVGFECLIEKICDVVQLKKLQGISDVIDFIDCNYGLCVVIGVKMGFDLNVVFEQLYWLILLEDFFSINNVVLVDGQLCMFGFKELLSVYVGYCFEVIIRCSCYCFVCWEECLYFVEGLFIVIFDIDEVIQVIWFFDDLEQVCMRLCLVFDFSEFQVEYILELWLCWFIKFFWIELESERDVFLVEIVFFCEFFGSLVLLCVVVVREFDVVVDVYGIL